MTASARPQAILLTGVVGSGKTSVAAALAALLEERGTAYAVVDLDWLAWFAPAPGHEIAVGEMLARNLRAVWANLAGAGVERLVLARYVQTAADADAIREALDGVDVVTVRLDVPLEALEARVRARDTGEELAEHLALIAADASAPRFEDAHVRTDGITPAEAAYEVLRAAGWQSA